mmetsp:Transcript_32443/g.80330  ORF Transcript_32443/g.80330 Transcript_32443/m.80330 type:complete len:331 (-) Transcript_32443:795-1787(-)
MWLTFNHGSYFITPKIAAGRLCPLLLEDPQASFSLSFHIAIDKPPQPGDMYTLFQHESGVRFGFMTAYDHDGDPDPDQVFIGFLPAEGIHKHTPRRYKQPAENATKGIDTEALEEEDKKRAAKESESGAAEGEVSLLQQLWHQEPTPTDDSNNNNKTDAEKAAEEEQATVEAEEIIKLPPTGYQRPESMIPICWRQAEGNIYTLAVSGGTFRLYRMGFPLMDPAPLPYLTADLLSRAAPITLGCDMHGRNCFKVWWPGRCGVCVWLLQAACGCFITATSATLQQNQMKMPSSTSSICSPCLIVAAMVKWTTVWRSVTYRRTLTGARAAAE